MHLFISESTSFRLLTLKRVIALFLHVFEQFSSKLRYYKQYDIFDFISQLRTVENSEKAPLTVAKLDKLVYAP